MQMMLKTKPFALLEKQYFASRNYIWKHEPFLIQIRMVSIDSTSLSALFPNMVLRYQNFHPLEASEVM